MHKYTVDDFNGENILADTMEDAIEKKIGLLKDFRFLKDEDERTEVVRIILSDCKTERELDNAIHDVVRFKETLDEFIARKEKELC